MRLPSVGMHLMLLFSSTIAAFGIFDRNFGTLAEVTQCRQRTSMQKSPVSILLQLKMPTRQKSVLADVRGQCRVYKSYRSLLVLLVCNTVHIQHLPSGALRLWTLSCICVVSHTKRSITISCTVDHKLTGRGRTLMYNLYASTYSYACYHSLTTINMCTLRS